MTWPRIFHRVWLDEEERPEFAAWRQRLAELHPRWEIRTYQDSKELDWLKHLDLFRELLETDPFGRAPDLLRYELLWKFGGCYIDTDFEPLRPMDELFEDLRPFAAWESDRTMCTALLAAPPKHPAIGVLLDGVVERLEATKGKPANEAIGPEYATALWRERADVRRLPPWTFYPVGWYEKNLLGQIDYPERTYAVHHWAKGWDPKGVTAVRGPAPSMSALIAFRDVDGSRTPLWDVIRAQFEQALPEVELVVATDDGTDPFHKTLALNRAAAKATGEVFIVTDADTWLSADIVREAAQFVAETPTRWSKPWTHKLKLNQEGTDYILDLGKGWNGTIDHRAFGRPEGYNTFGHSPPLIMHRSAYEAVHGFDERMRGWGQEDVAFSLSLTRLFGAPKKYRGHAIHLFHPRLGVSGNDKWAGQESALQNRELVGEYRRARTPEAMRLVIEQRGSHDRRISDDAVRDVANA